IDELAERNASATPLGSFGIVAGATIEAGVADFSRLNGPILVPGVGAQGGTAEQVRRVFGDALRAVIPSSSREILGKGPDVDALRDAVRAQAEAFTFLRA